MLVLCLLGTGARADIALPELGDGASSLISPQMERRIGRDFLKQIHAALPTVDDPLLKYYVSTELNRLAQHSDLDEPGLTPVLIDAEDINAFAAPGGIVGINLGLLVQAEDVHEYSGVVAHELAHLSQRHFARGVEAQRAQMLPNLASLLAAIMIGAIGGGDAGIAAISSAQAAAQSRQLRYSRERETEADRIGMNTLIRSGMDPTGMSRMFERMQRAYRFTRKPPEFLLTHPLTERRITDARTQAQSYQGRTFEDSLDYQLMRARALVHFADSPQSAADAFAKAVRDDPEDLAARYGLALAHSELGDHDRAIAVGDALYSRDRHSILYTAAYGDLLLAAGKTDQALALLARALVINPDNPPLAMLYAEGLVDAREFEQAEQILERQSVLRPNDVDVWYNLAEVAGLAGNIVGVHLARAEFFALHGGYHKAIQHLEYARRLIHRREDEMLARLDQRIIDLRTELRERSS